MSTSANITAVDRMGLTLFFALSIHTVVILGISFNLEKEKRQPPPDRTLEIMVVANPEKPKKPKEADFLAQTSQQGGGQEEKAVKPTTELTPPAPKVSPRPARESQPSPPPAAPPEQTRRVLTQAKPAKKKVDSRIKKPPQPTKQKAITAAQILASTNKEIARLTAQLDKKTRAYAKRPRKKVLTASTQEYKYANYLEAWRRKVENIGNLNYPDEAKRRKLYGHLVLSVSVRPDGTVQAITVLRSSGHKLLDDAAIRIVRLAAPYAPFPAEIRKETDILEITRTWQFVNNNTLFSR